MERSATYFHPSKPHDGCPWSPNGLKVERWNFRVQGFMGDISEEFVGSRKIGIEVERGFTTLRDPKGLHFGNIPSLLQGVLYYLDSGDCDVGTFSPDMKQTGRLDHCRTRGLKMGQRDAYITVNCIGHRARFALRVPWVPCHILSHVWSPQRERRCVTAMQRCHLFTRWSEMSPWRENILNLYQLQVFPIGRHDVC